MKEIIRRFLLSMGYEIKKYSPLNSTRALLQKILAQNNIDFVIDIGANAGQHATILREIGYTGSIISFEPMKSAFSKLASKAKGDDRWRTENFAIGTTDEEGLIHISENSYSSSILGIKDAHVSAAPQSKYIAEEKIRIARLEKFIDRDALSKYKGILLKMDVQGYEMNVIESAAFLLPNVKIVQAELSFVPMYDNGPLYNDLISKMESMGFELFSIVPEFIDPNSARLLQGEGIFINSKLK